MWNKTGVIPKPILKAFNRKWRIMTGVTEKSYISMEDVENKTFLKFTTKPHGAIAKDLDLLLKFRPKIYYYEEIEKTK